MAVECESKSRYVIMVWYDDVSMTCPAVMRGRIACLEDRTIVQNTSESTFFETSMASPCRDLAPDPRPNANPDPHYRNVSIPAWSSKARGPPTDYTCMCCTVALHCAQR